MSKFEKFRESLVGSVVILAVISAVVVGLLALTYELTKDKIAGNRDRIAQAAFYQVMPEADVFTEITDVDFSPEVKLAMVAKNSAGYGFRVITAGYGGEVDLVVGVDNSGKITGVAPPETHSETQGIGTMAFEESYIATYTGIAKADEVDTVAGATVTSSAIKKAVGIALDSYLLVADPAAAAEAANAEAGEVDVLTAGYTSIEGLSLPAGVSNASKSAAGEYLFETTSKGFGGELKLFVFTDATGKVTNIVAPHGSDETEGIGTPVLEQDYLSTFYGKSNSDGVDVSAGATITSGGVMTAVDLAAETYKLIAGGGEQGESPLLDLTTLTKIQGDLPEEVDGAYTTEDSKVVVIVTVKGYENPMTLQILGSEDGLSAESIAVVSQKETRNLGTRVFEEEYLSQFYGKASTDGIDVIASATTSSKALANAVDIALGVIAEHSSGATSSTPLETLPEIEGLIAGYTTDTGYSFDVSVKGYNNAQNIELTVSVASGGNVEKIVVGKHEETRNLGTRALEAEYLEQFYGQSGTASVDAIASATISSKAVGKAVNIALEAYGAVA